MDSHIRSQFNIETAHADVFKEETRDYRSISSSSPSTFQLQVLLSIPEPPANQVLTHFASDSYRAPVEPAPRYILLESWFIHFTRMRKDEMAEVEPPVIYKQGISLFRSIYTLLRILPAWKLGRRLRDSRVRNFSIVVKLVSTGSDSPDGILGFGEEASIFAALESDIF